VSHYFEEINLEEKNLLPPEITLLQIKSAIFGYLGIKEKKHNEQSDKIKMMNFPSTEMTEKEMNLWLKLKDKKGRQTFPDVGKFLRSIRG